MSAAPRLPLRRLLNAVKTGTTPPSEQLSWLSDGAIPWYSPGDIEDSLRLADPARTVKAEALSEGWVPRFPAGSTVLVGIGANVGKVAFLNHDASGNQQLTCLVPGPRIVPRFLAWQMFAIQDELRATAPSATLPILNNEFVRSLSLAVPPISKQRKIVDYLDRETARIDALIAAKRRMVELLDERRVATAHATITGVRLPGPRRSSPVAWLGSLPNHWQIASLGSLFDVRLGRMLNAERSVGPHMRPYIRNVNVRWEYVDVSDLAEMDFPPAERSRYLLRAGDLLVNEGGAGIGRAAIWQEQIPEIYYQKSVHRIRSRGALGVRWLLEWMRVAVDRNVFQVEGNLATIPHVPAEALRRYPVPLPPIPEAEALLARLEQTLEREAALRRANESQIAILRERRQALITQAVTGQLDIPEAA